MSNDLGRRSFLKAVGAAAATLPVFRALERSARGGATSPLRFAAFVDPHGTVLDYWRPQGTETNFSIAYPNAILSPLAPLQKKMLVLDGMSIMPAKAGTQYLGHKGYVAALTGIGDDLVSQDAQSLSTNTSFDQYLAGKIGSLTKLRSLEIASGETGGYKSEISWAATVSGGYHAPVPRLNNPYDVYKYVFGNFNPAPGGDPNAARLLAIKKSRLDYVQADLARLSARLGATERAKLDQHLQAVRDIENQLAAMGSATAACTKPGQPTLSIPTSGTLDGSLRDVDGDIRNVMVDMMAQAFACDLTRVATFQLGSSDDVRALPYASPLLTTSALENGDMHLTTHDQDSLPNGKLQVAACQRYYAQVVARFASALDAIPEGDGTVLDHTCILWIGSMSNAAIHDNWNVPCTLIGGANGAFRTGRYLKVTGPDGGSAAHNHLLVSILNAFGFSDQTFGSTKYTGPLANLT
jgi:Protein of unknown function (DUF1552)